jgi:hypothetical protein
VRHNVVYDFFLRFRKLFTLNENMRLLFGCGMAA